jgi:hypothetical protein
MGALSFFITLASVAVAVVMAILAARVLRSERLRSDARVEALARMAGVADSPPANALADFLPEPDADPDRSAAVPMAPAEDPAGLFAEPEMPSPWRVRVAIAAGIGGVLLAVAGLAMLGSRPHSGRGDVAAVSTPTAPLELLALGDTMAEGRLTVTGRVASTSPVGAVMATVSLFDADGEFVASGRAPLEAGPLGPGSQSAFSVTLPVDGSVVRYRVSFRDAAGRAVAHVDRRETRTARAPSARRRP